MVTQSHKARVQLFPFTVFGRSVSSLHPKSPRRGMKSVQRKIEMAHPQLYSSSPLCVRGGKKGCHNSRLVKFSRSGLSINSRRNEAARWHTTPSHTYSPINTLICTCTPLSSHCRCCISRSSTTGTCSCTAIRASTGACYIPGRSTSGCSRCSPAS